MSTEANRRLCVPSLIGESLERLSLKYRDVDRKQRPVLTYCAPDRSLFDPQCRGLTRDEMETAAQSLCYVPRDVNDLRSMLEGAYRMEYIIEQHKGSLKKLRSGRRERSP